MDRPGKARLFTPDFVLATLANFFNSVGFQILTATLPVYVLTLGGGQAEAGLVSGALSVVALIFRPFIGWLTDAWNRRPLVLIGTSCYWLASVVYLLAGSIPCLLLGRFVHGFGLSCYTTAANAYIADIAPLARRSQAMGIFSSALSLGFIVGPVIGFMIIGATGFDYLFYFTGGLALLTLILSLFPRERRPSQAGRRHPWSLRTGVVAIAALPVSWIFLCMGLGFGTLVTFISIFAQPRGLANPGYYFMVQAGAVILSRLFADRLADRHGRAAAIVPGILLMALALVLLPSACGLFQFLLSAALFGLGFGAAQPATMALLIDRVRPEERGLATSTYFSGFDIGMIVGAVLMGVISERWGYGVMWSLASVCTLLGLAGLVAGRRYREGRVSDPC